MAWLLDDDEMHRVLALDVDARYACAIDKTEQRAFMSRVLTARLEQNAR
jgi:hypothetical protein